jgi:pectate lyase
VDLLNWYKGLSVRIKKNEIVPLHIYNNYINFTSKMFEYIKYFSITLLTGSLILNLLIT